MIKSGLKTKILGREVACYDSATSTMDIASQKAFEGADEGLVVCAETQTKGRGRLGRQWLSSKGKGLYFSTVLRPKARLDEISGLTLLLSVAVAKAIKNVYGFSVEIKWPNDIVVQQKKIAGILTELNAEIDRINFIVVGVGINVNESQRDLPKEATSVLEQTGKKSSRVELLQEILIQIEWHYLLFQKEGFESIFKDWKSLSQTLGKHVRVIQDSGTIEGYAIDIDSTGALLIEKKDKTIVKKTSGEIIHLR